MIRRTHRLIVDGISLRYLVDESRPAVYEPLCVRRFQNSIVTYIKYGNLTDVLISHQSTGAVRPVDVFRTGKY